MKTIDVYQTNQNKIFMYATKANELAEAPGKFNVANGAYKDAPPAVPAGKLARRNSKDDDWLIQTDNRQKAFYVIDTGEQYSFGTLLNIGGIDAQYDGGGDVPAWLTDIKPILEVPEPEPAAE